MPAIGHRLNMPLPRGRRGAPLTASIGARPARFRRQRVLLVGCGDVGMRVAALLRGRVTLLALTSSPARLPLLRGAGIQPLTGNLDQASTLRRLAGLATRLIHLAPPAGHGTRDTRTLALARALRRRTLPQSLVYGSTSGVYGHCNGEITTETRVLNPDTPRAVRRIDAEAVIRGLVRSSGLTCCILRIPGIYASDRVDGTPRARLLKGTPVLQAQDDVFTNHIQADDLARACVATLWRGKPGRAYNINDDTRLKMGDYFDLAATLYGLTKPPRISRDLAKQTLPPMQLSFMGESRRMDNQRMKTELRLRLRYPTVRDGLLPAHTSTPVQAQAFA